MTNKYIIDRRLEDRSFLSFNYSKGGELYKIVTLPFFEDVVVEEQKRARLHSYNLLSRSSDLYSYLGAESRKLSLSFSMTLPHIIDSIKFVGRAGYIEDKILATFTGGKQPFLAPTQFFTQESTVQEAKYDYLVSGDLKDDVNYIANTEWGQKGITPLEKKKLIERYDSGAVQADLLEQGPTVTNTPGSTTVSLSTEGFDGIDSLTPDRDALIDTITFWVNIIRTCVSNDSSDVTNGPPVIRFNHGILYQDVPCLCKDYSISYDKMAGFDIDTLLPRKIDVSMSLEEFRQGDLGEYSYGEVVKRDNLAGWEAVFDKGTIDPGKV